MSAIKLDVFRHYWYCDNDKLNYTHFFAHFDNLQCFAGQALSVRSPSELAQSARTKVSALHRNTSFRFEPESLFSLRRIVKLFICFQA